MKTALIIFVLFTPLTRAFPNGGEGENAEQKLSQVLEMNAPKEKNILYALFPDWKDTNTFIIDISVEEGPAESRAEIPLLKERSFHLDYSADILSASFAFDAFDIFARFENIFHIDRPQAHYESESQMRNEFNAIHEALALPSSSNYFRIGLLYSF